MSTIADNIASIKERIAAAATRCGRDPASITLVAVSKAKPAAMIREAFEAGQRVFGENYAQELSQKAKELADLSIEWHFIGHLQKNKAKLVAPIATCVETVDSVEIAEALDRRAAQRLKCLIEVNLGDETSKSGVAPAGLEALARKMLSFKNTGLLGLMAIPPYDPDPEKSRSYFRRIKGLLDVLNDTLRPQTPLRAVSMGMSHDFEVAIEEGATIVRVGTAIFGER